MEATCVKHTFDTAHANCRQCGQSYCTTCLVYAFGPSKPPYCVKCAIGAAGVRSNAAPRPIRSKAEVREIQRAQARAAKEEAKQRKADLASGRPRLEGAAAATGTSPNEELARTAAPKEKAGIGRLVSRFKS